MKTSVVLSLIFFIFSTCALQVVKEKSGPYKTTIARSEKCKSTPMPYQYAKNPDFIYYCESYNSGGKMLLRANLTVLRVNPNLKTIVRTYIKEGDKWKAMYNYKNVGCNGFLLQSMKIAFNVQSHDSCIPKGTYSFKELDFYDIQQKWMKTFIYGKHLWTIQILTKDGLNFCWEFETDITPKPK